MKNLVFHDVGMKNLVFKKNHKKPTFHLKKAINYKLKPHAVAKLLFEVKFLVPLAPSRKCQICFSSILALGGNVQSPLMGNIYGHAPMNQTTYNFAGSFLDGERDGPQQKSADHHHYNFSPRRVAALEREARRVEAKFLHMRRIFTLAERPR